MDTLNIMQLVTRINDYGITGITGVMEYGITGVRVKLNNWGQNKVKCLTNKVRLCER